MRSLKECNSIKHLQGESEYTLKSWDVSQSEPIRNTINLKTIILGNSILNGSSKGWSKIVVNDKGISNIAASQQYSTETFKRYISLLHAWFWDLCNTE